MGLFEQRARRGIAALALIGRAPSGRVLLASAAVFGVLATAPWVPASASPTSDSGTNGLPISTNASNATAPSPSTPLSTHVGSGFSQFQGLGPCGLAYCWGPGEPVVAVGPTDIVETVNTQAAVFDKNGFAELADFPFETFWTGGGTEQCVDPRTIYLPGDNRFAISCTDFGANVLRFAISQTSDPTGPWYKYSVGQADDQPKILATADKFIIAGNAATTEDIYVYNKADVLSGTANPQVTHLSTVHSNLYQAAVEQSYNDAGYLVSTNQCQGCQEWLATVTGTPATDDVALSETALGATTDLAPQEPAVPGGYIGAGDLDGRTYNAVYETTGQGNHGVIQYSTADNCGTVAAPRDCVVSGRIDLSGPIPKRIYERSLGAPGWDYTYGAVGLNGHGDVFEAYSRSNASNAPGAAALGPGFDLTLKAADSGGSSCASTQTPPCDERWGDYLGATFDPSDPSVVWVTGLFQLAHGPYGGSGEYAWGTVITEVRDGMKTS